MAEEFDIKIDFRNKTPIAVQLQREMRRLIHEGVLQPGSQLPTVRGLAAKLHVNFNTVARVYRVLDGEGIITTQQGRGSYILEDNPLSPLVARPTREEQIARLVAELLEKAQRLQISSHELQSELTQKVHQEGKKKLVNLRKKIQGGQKRHPITPAWVRELRQAAIKPDLHGSHGKAKRRSS